jgi:hypothetical protein
MKRAALCASALALAAQLATQPAAHAQPAGGCTAGTRLVRETSKAWHCLPITLPRVSPGFFVTPEEVQFARAQIAALNLQKRRYENQMAALERIRGGLELAARDLNGVRREIVLDNMGHALNVIGWAAGDLLQGPAKQAVLTQLGVLKGEVSAIAAAEAPPGSERRYQKAIDASFSFKNVVVDLAGTMSPAVADAFKRSSDTLPHMVRISERFSRPNPDKSTWQLTAATLDDVAAGIGVFVGVLKANRSTTHIIGGEVALWHIERSKASLDDAFVGSQTAKRYYLQKIAENEQAQETYRERIRRAAVK